MAHVAYVNGRYLPLASASVHIEDRGFQFADGVYEVIGIHRGRLLDEAAHLQRLDRSLSALRIAWPMPQSSLCVVIREVMRRNRLKASGIIYLQVTRGSAPRAHAFPGRARSSLVMTGRAILPFDAERARQGVAVVTLPDLRWRRCDIKSVSLLPNVLGKQQAVEAGAYEAWMVDDAGDVTEGTSSNAWIVTRSGELITRQTGSAILNGITRQVVERLASEQGVKVVKRPFSLGEAWTAAEAFITSTTAFIKPVIRIDGRTIGDGRIGPVTAKMLGYFIDAIEKDAATSAVGARHP